MEWFGKLPEVLESLLILSKIEWECIHEEEEFDHEYNLNFRASMFNISNEFSFLLLDCCYHSCFTKHMLQVTSRIYQPLNWISTLNSNSSLQYLLRNNSLLYNSINIELLLRSILIQAIYKYKYKIYIYSCFNFFFLVLILDHCFGHDIQG